MKPLISPCLSVGLFFGIFSGTASAWLPGTYPAATRGFTVTNTDRNDVVSFWHAVYKASEGYESRIKWTGNYSGNNGTVSAEFMGDVERRLNYFRAMCGVSSSTNVVTNAPVVIEFDDVFKPLASGLKSSAAQDAALMMVRNYNASTGQNPAMTHNPPVSLIGWSPLAWNGASKGNFAFSVYGPGAITEYMREEFSSSLSVSTSNSSVGHRRWNLYPPATTFATGDQPGTSSAVPPSNVLYVLQNPIELLKLELPKVVTYPPAGFYPAELNSRFWSLSCRGADFKNAVVSMSTAAGAAVPLVATRRDTSFGDSSLIWEIADSSVLRSVINDTTYNVTVSGMAGLGVPSSYSYSVTLINPDRILSNQTITGGSSLSAKKTGAYTFTPPSSSEALQVVAARKNIVAWKEGAEAPKSAKVIDGTAANYDLIIKPASYAGYGMLVGKYAFHLTFPTSYDLIKRGVPDQTFELDRDLLVKTGGKLKFQYRRGYMTKSSVLAVEASSNGGITWSPVGAAIKGVSDTKYDAKISTFTGALPKSTEPVRIRFRYYATGGSIYTQEAAPKSPTGIFIDDIQVVKCDYLETKKINSLSPSANSLVFNASTAGTKLVGGDQWSLRLRAKIGNKWFPCGPAKTITIAK